MKRQKLKTNREDKDHCFKKNCYKNAKSSLSKTGLQFSEELKGKTDCHSCRIQFCEVC